MTTATLSRRDETLCDVFTTALEGGIGYWSRCSLYHWSDDAGNQVRDFKAEITETDDDEDRQTEWVIDRKVISQGIDRLYRYLRGLSQEGTVNQYQWQAIKDLYHAKYDDADYDADTADMIVQMGLFGELVYG